MLDDWEVRCCRGADVNEWFCVLLLIQNICMKSERKCTGLRYNVDEVEGGGLVEWAWGNIKVKDAALRRRDAVYKRVAGTIALINDFGI